MEGSEGKGSGGFGFGLLVGLLARSGLPPRCVFFCLLNGLIFYINTRRCRSSRVESRRVEVTI